MHYTSRWGGECRATHGGYWTHTDRYNPGELQEHKFENAMTIDKVSWGSKLLQGNSDQFVIFGNI